MKFEKVDDTMFSKKHSDDVFEFVEYGEMDENSNIQLFFVRSAKLAFSNLTEAEVEDVIKPYYSSLEQLKSIHEEDYKEAVLKCRFKELSFDSAVQYSRNKRIQIVNAIFNINAETCLQMLKAMGLTINELEIEIVAILEKEYVANVVYQGGECRMIPVRSSLGKKAVVAYLLEQDIPLNEMVSITIT